MNNPNCLTITGQRYMLPEDVNAHKRQHLLLEAMAWTKSNVNRGPPDLPGDADRLQETVNRLELGDRVVLDLDSFLLRRLLVTSIMHGHALIYQPRGRSRRSQ